MIGNNVVGEGWFQCPETDRATHITVILRSRALARRSKDGRERLAHPSRLAAGGGEHLRMTVAMNAFLVETARKQA
jgi:hypothetical protein